MNDGLASILEKVAKARQVKEEAAAALKDANRRLDELESLATEMLGASGLRKVTVAGRTWWSEDSLHLTIPKEVRDEAFDAAEAEGILDELMTLSTATLKAWLVERAKEQGLTLADASKGTAFENLVSSYCRTRLCSRAS